MNAHAGSDREAITDALHRYCRGVDRMDRDLILSAYHPDAVDYRGSFTGSPAALVEWMLSKDPDRVASQHCLTNVMIEVEGDTGHVESYFLATIRRAGRSELETFGGRYVDQVHKRGGEWRVSVRVVVMDWHSSAPALPIGPASDIGTQDRTDPSYSRPLDRFLATEG